MLRAFTARRIAAAAAYGGGGITALGGATFALVMVEARLARKIIQATPNGDPPVADGLYGEEYGRAGRGAAPPTLSLVVLGDSTAAGLGVHTAAETPAAVLAGGLAELAGRPVRLTNVARPGARSAALGGQVERALEVRPDLAVIMVGANDVTSRVPAAESVRHLADTVARLRAAGAQVVAGTCPDLGSVKPLMQPLRWIARRASRQLAAAQTIAVVERGGRSVSIGDLLGREFAADPHSMFSADRYHPSARGYAAAAAALLPSLASALDLEPDLEAWPVETRIGDGVLPVYLAAAAAAERAGTEVSGASVAGRERGPRGRWARLLRRRSAAAGPDAGPESLAGTRTEPDAATS